MLLFLEIASRPRIPSTSLKEGRVKYTAKMRKTLHEISVEYNIPVGTLRSAIHREQIQADKSGGTRFIDDESANFREYLKNYNPKILDSESSSSLSSIPAIIHQTEGDQLMTTKCISVYNKKGGIGKTTFVTNLAYTLATLGRTVVIIDCDSQGNTSALIPKYGKPTLTDVVRDNVPLKDAMYQARHNLYIVPSDPNTWTAANHILITRDDDVLAERLDAFLMELKPTTPAPQYPKNISIKDFEAPTLPSEDQIHSYPDHVDYLFFDHVPNPDALTDAALLASNEIIIPCEMESYAIQGLAQMLIGLQNKFKRRHQINITGIVPFNLDHRRAMTEPYLRSLYQMFPQLVWKPIHTDATAPNAQGQRMTAVEFKRNSQIAREFFEMALRMEGFTGTSKDFVYCEGCVETQKVAAK